MKLSKWKLHWFCDLTPLAPNTTNVWMRKQTDFNCGDYMRLVFSSKCTLGDVVDYSPEARGLVFWDFTVVLECFSWPRDARTGLLLICAVFVLSRSRLGMTLLIPDNKSLQEWGSDHQPHYPEPPAVALHQHCSTLSSQETGQILSVRISWQARMCSEPFVNNCVQLTCSISDTTHKLPQVSLRF